MIADRNAARASAVVPNWNGRRWLPACLEAIAAQELPFSEVLVVDNGSSDDSLAYIKERHPCVRLIELGSNTGFAKAANVGVAAAKGELVALINTDVVLASDWLGRTTAAINASQRTASVACKMLSLDDPTMIYDAGDVLRRDGACEQRGRFARDTGLWERSEDVFGACAGAALYRRDALLELGGFDERFFAYLEDVDLALRLRLAGWSCRYEPVVALHAAQGSSGSLPGGHEALVARNTLMLVAKAFPIGWLPQVAYRQLAWAWHAAQEGRLGAHLRALAASFRFLPDVLRGRRELRRGAAVPIEEVVPSRPVRGPLAGGHPAQIAASEEPIECIWCGGAHARRRRRAHARVDGSAHAPTPYEIAICERCGAGSTYPIADEHELERAYGHWYRPRSGRFGAGGDRLLALSRATLAGRLDAVAPPGPVLDVGSGDGALLSALRARGREALGLERDARGEGVLPIEVTEFDQRRSEWAAVVFWHTLEHLRDPAAALDRATALLVPGGILVVAVPNLSSWQARSFGERWFHLDMPRHFVHLPASTLERGLRHRGLQIIRRSNWRGGQLVFGWLHGLVGLLPGQPDLYSAIRRPEAQRHATTGLQRTNVLAMASALAPVAALLAAAEVAAGHGGTVYIEARRP